jgi:hypothetical protein
VCECVCACVCLYGDALPPPHGISFLINSLSSTHSLSVCLLVCLSNRFFSSLLSLSVSLDIHSFSVIKHRGGEGRRREEEGGGGGAGGLLLLLLLLSLPLYGRRKTLCMNLSRDLTARLGPWLVSRQLHQRSHVRGGGTASAVVVPQAVRRPGGVLLETCTHPYIYVSSFRRRCSLRPPSTRMSYLPLSLFHLLQCQERPITVSKETY